MLCIQTDEVSDHLICELKALSPNLLLGANEVDSVEFCEELYIGSHGLSLLFGESGDAVRFDLEGEGAGEPEVESFGDFEVEVVRLLI